MGLYLADTQIKDVMEDPVYENWGGYIFPEGRWLLDTSWTLSDVGRLLPFHTKVSVRDTISVLEYLHAEAGKRRVFYTFSENKDTGLFFFQGKAYSPFALILSGGKFSYVASIHEGFPIAMYLAKRGYSAFVLQYRTAGIESAEEDLSSALDFILSHKEEFAVFADNYSLWGCGTGGEIISGLSQVRIAPAATIFGYSDVRMPGLADAPSFMFTGNEDQEDVIRGMSRRKDALLQMEKDARFLLFPDLSSRFSLGKGTPANGWIDSAVSFWESEIR